jgi:hypothetical protein
MVHLCCIEFLTFQCMDYVFVCDLCMYYVLDNLWYSTSKNICVPMLFSILYIVFHFSSILQIVYV